MLLKSTEDKIVEEYVNYTNDVVGVLSLSLGASCLSFEHPEPFAQFFLVVVLIWMFSKQNSMTKRYFVRNSGFSNTLLVVWRIKIYLIGVVFLGSIALGIVSRDSVYRFLGY